MVLSVAQQNSMGRITPTELAEATYQASKAPRMPTGPSGLPVPPARASFRMTVDSGLLDRITKTALGAHHRRTLRETDVEFVRKHLLADLERRYPAADMAVMARYGAAKSHSVLIVRTRSLRPYRVDLETPLDLPAGALEFTVPGAYQHTPVVPDVTLWFFDKLRDLEEDRLAYIGVSGVNAWPVKFKRTEGRPPMWLEIEAAFPIVGAWLADERRRMAPARGAE